MAKTAVIWGVGGGIGSALARLLIDKGWQVAGVSRDSQQAGQVTPLAFEADFSNPNSVQAAVYGIAQEIEEIDFWVYAAGDIQSMASSSMEAVDWKRILDANLNGLYYAIHYSQALLSKDAAVYILGAVSERMRLPGLGAYAAAKAGVEALGDVLRKELRRSVVVVRPAAVKTSFWEKVPFKMPATAMTVEELAEKIYQAYEANTREATLDL